MKSTTRTNRTVFHAAIAGVFTATLVPISAHAAPPVQWRVPLRAEWLPLDAETVAWGSEVSGKLNDSGVFAVSISSAAGSTIAIGVDDDFEIVRPWVSDNSQPEVWKASASSMLLSDAGRLVFLATNTASGAAVHTLRELTKTGGVWTEREIARDQAGLWKIETSVSYAMPIAANNLGETIWIERSVGGGFYDDRIMIDRGTGAGPELYLSEADAVIPQASGGIDGPVRLFDDASVMYGVRDDFGYYALRRSQLPGSTTLQEYLVQDASEECGVWGSDRGDLLIGHYQLIWQPAGPSPVGAFNIDAEFGGFAGFGSFSRGAVSSDGRFIVQAGIPWTGLTALYVGPDAATDEIVREGDVLFGQTLDGLTLLDLNTRGELLCTFNREVEFNGQLYKLPTPLLGTLCPADVNRDGVFDNGDIGEFVTQYLDGSMRTDFNNDGLLDNGDIGEFITQFLDGC